MFISYHLVLATDEIFDDAIELDESYFGGYRKGRRDRSAAGKIVVLGILKRQGRATPLWWIMPSLKANGQRPLQNPPKKSPKVPSRHLGDFS